MNEFSDYIIRVENLSCFHGGNKILDSISFSIKRGEFVVIFGKNAGGKSTLAKHLNALYIPDEGNVYVDGINTKNENERFNIRRKVSFMFQNSDNQIVAEKVEEDVAFGLENLGVPIEEIKKRIDESLEFSDLLNKKEEYIQNLSGGMKQKLVLAGILAMRSDCLVLDEPTSMLDYESRKIIIKKILKINKEKKITVILLTHHFDEFILADRFLVLDEGRLVSDITDGDFMKSCFFSGTKIKCDLKRKKNKKEKKILEVKNLSYFYNNSNELILNNVNFDIYKKEIVGIKGKSGSGKTTLVKLIKGILKPSQGKILFKNKAVDGAEKEIGMAFQFPENQFFEEKLIDEVVFGPKNLGLSEKDAYDIAKKYLNIMDIKKEQFNISPFKFSGGQMRKIAIASIISMEPEILILDEPTSSLDYFSKSNLLELIECLNKKLDMTVIIISHSYEDLKSICDRVISIKNGEISEV
ncbi:MAG: ATP-binding cassette domain-containing protein [Candidatus Improbicoccus pseudotrichonymphae]|uniref:ATP-binding cassette domain-containing protein n=1 Tax=Candidatus Improbicoccus pseudotrichonymphae TaxID=3033792 RepID=A0AA48KYE0_9FIRM|nr:MAG: ATP-binding cassette domain-containing protein [Candidatus Improbicoccus pseudotrichonymphae]